MDEIDRLLSEFHDHFTRNPNSCVNLGVSKRLGELPDPSLSEVDARVAEARALRKTIERADRKGLDFDGRLDLDLAALVLDAEVHADTYLLNGRRRLEQMPTAGDDIGDGIFLLIANDPRPVAERLENVTSRIAKVPEYLEMLLGRLRVPVSRWVRIELDKVGELPALFSAATRWATEAQWADLSRLEKACATAASAIGAYAAKLRTLSTTPNVHFSDADARRLVALRGIDASFEELHGIAKRFLAENTATVTELRARLVRKHGLPSEASAEELQELLERKYRVEVGDGGSDAVLRRYEDERERILRFVRERDLFPVFEEQEIRILRTPGFMEPSIPAGAMMPPPPFREGVRTSLVYLTLPQDRLHEHTELSIPTMMIHEGIPGHHLQLATASLHASMVRRHVLADDQAEGWTTMLEDYMLDLGYMGDLTDEARFCAKRDIARIGARLPIDLFFMTGEREYLSVGVDADTTSDDPFVAAGNLLRAVTGFTKERTETELNWYSLLRGYPLSYLLGNSLVWALKRDFAEAQRGRLGGLDLDRLFHRVYLESGNMPLSFLRRVFEQRGLVGRGDSAGGR